MKDFRIATKCFIVNDGKLLMLKRAPKDEFKPGMWEFPGGQLEVGEDPFEGSKRETKEETGLDIEILYPTSVRHFTKSSDGCTITMLVFLCKALNSDVKLSKEHTEFDWVPLEDAKGKLGDFFHHDVDIFNKLGLGKHL